MNKKLLHRLLCTHGILIGYIVIIAVIESLWADTTNGFLSLEIFGTNVNLWIVLIIMYCLELLSTFTFQLRMKLTADYEITKKEKYIELIPLIAGFSWMVAGFQGIIFLTSVPANPDYDLTLAFLKLVPVFIATYNGVYTTLLIKNQTNTNKSV